VFLGRGYSCSASKGDIHHPQVKETFPENFVGIALYLLFISFYAKFKIFAKKATLYFFTRQQTTFLKN